MTIRITKLVSVGIITLGCVLGPLAARADEAAVAATYADIEKTMGSRSFNSCQAPGRN